MTAASLIDECESLGVRLRPDPAGGLKVKAPPGTLTAELAGRLRDAKAELLAELARRESRRFPDGTIPEFRRITIRDLIEGRPVVELHEPGTPWV